jgi:hypothetical protein
MDSLIQLVTPVDATSWWTLVTGVATCILAATALVGLYSLHLTKKDMRERTTRREKETAIELVRVFLTTIVPASDAYAKEFGFAGVPTFGPASAVMFGENEYLHRDSAERWLRDIGYRLSVQGGEQLNAVEGWAMAVEAGLANEDMMFYSCGSPYCGLIRQFTPQLIFQRTTHPDVDAYGVAVRLYQRWRARLANERESVEKTGFWQRAAETEAAPVDGGDA